MREILFRGKRLGDQSWVEGCMFVSDMDQSTYIECGSWRVKIETEVDPTTVGQYTGLTDKNGVKIFEGDIVSAKNNICGETYRFLVEFGVCGGIENVEHSVGFPCFFFKEMTGVIPSEYMMRKDPVYFLNAYQCEVVGNIHDNPELLGGGAADA